MYNLEEMLGKKGVDLNEGLQNVSWLALSGYDDVGNESIFVDEYIDFEGVLFDEHGAYEVSGQAVNQGEVV